MLDNLFTVLFQSRFLAVDMDALAIFSLSILLESNISNFSENGSGQTQGIKYPFPPWLINDLGPPTLEATTGTPQAIASKATRPKLS